MAQKRQESTLFANFDGAVEHLSSASGDVRIAYHDSRYQRQLSAEQRLWLAVLVQAIHDALQPTNGHPAFADVTNEARRWIHSRSRNDRPGTFRFVAAVLGLCRENVRRLVPRPTPVKDRLTAQLWPSERGVRIRPEISSLGAKHPGKASLARRLSKRPRGDCGRVRLV